MEKQLIEQLNRLLEDQAMAVADSFYENLFVLSKDLSHSFRNSDLPEQKKRLIEGLKNILQLTQDESGLKAYLGDLGVRHVAYEVKDADYDLVEKALVQTLALFIDPSFDYRSLVSAITAGMRLGVTQLSTRRGG